MTFSDILGQASAVDALIRAYRGDRLPHGLLFAGPVGVGKGTTAAALAALFLCEHPADARPCGQCASCQALAAGSHPDYHIVTRQLIRYHDRTGKSKGIDLSIEVIRRELVAPAGLKAALGHGKVFVIEEAESMTTAAQNAMLKTLEEPAGRTLIVLLTDQPDSLLPTIRSRCQSIRFAALDEDLVARELAKRGIGHKSAQDAAALAAGSLGLALQWLNEGVVERARDLAGHLDALLAGRAPEGLEGWFKQAADAYAEKQLEKDELASKDQATRQGLSLYLALAASHLRRLMKSETDPDRLERICCAIDAVARSEQYLWANVNTSLIFQQLTLAWERDLAAAPILRQ